MATQDDITFRSQEFANQTGARGDVSSARAGEAVRDLGTVIGNIPQRIVRDTQQRQQFAMDQQLDATKLTTDQLLLQQAREELDWARQLRSSKAMKNALDRDNAQTALAQAQSAKAIQELGGFNAERYFADPVYQYGLIESGIMPSWDPKTGQVEFGKDEVPQDMRDKAREERKRLYEQRYGSRAIPFEERAALQDQRVEGQIKVEEAKQGNRLEVEDAKQGARAEENEKDRELRERELKRREQLGRAAAIDKQIEDVEFEIDDMRKHPDPRTGKVDPVRLRFKVYERERLMQQRNSMIEEMEDSGEPGPNVEDMLRELFSEGQGGQ